MVFAGLSSRQCVNNLIECLFLFYGVHDRQHTYGNLMLKNRNVVCVYDKVNNFNKQGCRRKHF